VENYEDDPAVVDAFKLEQVTSEVSRLHRAAQEAWAASLELAETDYAASAKHADDAISFGAHAFWYAEETDLEDEMHNHLDKYGEWRRVLFGCKLNFDGTDYQQTCPVAIAHKRIGLSVGMLVRERVCAICQLRIPDECKHRGERIYNVPGGIGPRGFCRVCGSEKCSTHATGQMYRTLQTRIVTDLELEEISFVRRPAQPLARITSIPVPWAQIADKLPNAVRGDPINCDRCLNPCTGLQEYDLASR